MLIKQFLFILELLRIRVSVRVTISVRVMARVGVTVRVRCGFQFVSNASVRVTTWLAETAAVGAVDMPTDAVFT